MLQITEIHSRVRQIFDKINKNKCIIFMLKEEANIDNF